MADDTVDLENIALVVIDDVEYALIPLEYLINELG
jgi:hypothetical protein